MTKDIVIMYAYKTLCFADCPHAKFGADCNSTCHCVGDAPCNDPVTGGCPDGRCESGWEGANCSLRVVGEWCMS